MALILDAAIIDDVKVAARWGWIKGITTNPTLLGRSKYPPEETLSAMRQVFSGPIFYQLIAESIPSLDNEVEKVKKILGDQLVLKIPATELGFEAAARFSRHTPCAMTAVYSPAQALIAADAGAKYVIYYYHRAIVLLGDGMPLTKGLVEAVRGTQTEIIAASIKNVEEVLAVKAAGVPHLTIPLSVLQAMVTAELSEKSVAEFKKDGKGVSV